MQAPLLQQVNHLQNLLLFDRIEVFDLVHDLSVQRVLVAVLECVFAADKVIDAALENVRYFYKRGQGGIGAATLDIGNVAWIYVQQVRHIFLRDALMQPTLLDF